jgi:hypothetical protein
VAEPTGETLVYIPGNPSGGEYDLAKYAADPSRGEVVGPYRSPLLGLISLYRPARVVALCTPEAMATVVKTKTEAEDHGIALPEIICHSLKLAPGEGEGATSLINQLAAVPMPDGPIHLDVTFGARSIMLPTLLMALVQLAAERWNLVRLTYVNLINRPPGGNQPVGVEDLSIYLHLPQLAMAVRELQTRAEIVPLIHAIHPFLRKEDGEQPTVADLKIFSDAVEYLQGPSLMKGEARQSLDRILRVLNHGEKEGPLVGPLLQTARDVLLGLRCPAGQRFGSPSHVAAVVRWYRSHGRPERALVLATECISWLVCTLILNLPYPSKGPDNNFYGAEDYLNLALKEHPQWSPLLSDLLELRRKLAPRRHRFAHAAFGNHRGDTIESNDQLLDQFDFLMEDPTWGIIQRGS